MTNYKTYQLAIQDAKARIETNPTDLEYVNTQLNKIIEWQNEILKLQSDPNFKLSDKVYTFNNKKEFKDLLDTERKIAKGLYKTTKVEGYHNYEIWIWSLQEHYKEYTDEQIQDLRIESLKDFIIQEHVKWSSKFSQGCDIMSGRSAWTRPVEGYYLEETLYCNHLIKDIFKHGQTSLQENN